RPADGNEVNAAWRLAPETKDQPTALVLTRQGVPTLEQTAEKAYEGVAKGAHVLSEEKEHSDTIMLATGPEVSLAMEAQEALVDEGIDTRVVSMPSWDRFEKQTDAYKESVLPQDVSKRLAIEMAASFGWERYTGLAGDVLAIDRFGASAKGDKIVEEYGFTVENVIQSVEYLNGL